MRRATGPSRLAFVLLLAAGAVACGAGREVSADAAAESSIYEYRPGSRDGIGKWYMGREISHVMGHLGAGWLERPARERQERTDLLIERLPLEADSVVADIGAGTGYFSFPVARRVPEGRVYAVDIQPEMLAFIEERRGETGLVHVIPVLGTPNSPMLPAGEIDLAFIVDAYHEFSHPREMGEGLYAALKPGGRLVLIEYRAEDASVPIKPLHKMSQAQARREMAALGFAWLETQDYLPQQHVLIFGKPAAD
jgi:SAM-dependent methyltransferase